MYVYMAYQGCSGNECLIPEIGKNSKRKPQIRKRNFRNNKIFSRYFYSEIFLYKFFWRYFFCEKISFIQNHPGILSATHFGSSGLGFLSRDLVFPQCNFPSDTCGLGQTQLAAEFSYTFHFSPCKTQLLNPLLIRDRIGKY